MNTQKTHNKKTVCYGQYRFNGHVQEVYETGAPCARLRSSALRKTGYRVISSAMGPQVTNVGLIKLTQLDIFGDVDALPDVKIERL